MTDLTEEIHNIDSHNIRDTAECEGNGSHMDNQIHNDHTDRYDEENDYSHDYESYEYEEDSDLNQNYMMINMMI